MAKPEEQTVDAPVLLDKEAERRCAQYIQVRQQLKALDEEHQKKRTPFVEVQNLLTAWMLDFLEKTGQTSAATPAGTFYRNIKYTASLADPELFMQFVIKHQRFDLLDRKANVTAVRDYVEDTKFQPPGVNLTSMMTVGVRSPSRKS